MAITVDRGTPPSRCQELSCVVGGLMCVQFEMIDAASALPSWMDKGCIASAVFLVCWYRVPLHRDPFIWLSQLAQKSTPCITENVHSSVIFHKSFPTSLLYLLHTTQFLGLVWHSDIVSPAVIWQKVKHNGTTFVKWMCVEACNTKFLYEILLAPQDAVDSTV